MLRVKCILPKGNFFLNVAAPRGYGMLGGLWKEDVELIIFLEEIFSLTCDLRAVELLEGQSRKFFKVLYLHTYGTDLFGVGADV